MVQGQQSTYNQQLSSTFTFFFILSFSLDAVRTATRRLDLEMIQSPCQVSPLQHSKHIWFKLGVGPKVVPVRLYTLGVRNKQNQTRPGAGRSQAQVQFDSGSAATHYSKPKIFHVRSRLFSRHQNRFYPCDKSVN